MSFVIQKLTLIKILLIISIRTFIKFGRKVKVILFTQQSPFLLSTWIQYTWIFLLLTCETEINQDVLHEENFMVKRCIAVPKRGFLGMCSSSSAETQDILVLCLFLIFNLEDSYQIKLHSTLDSGLDICVLYKIAKNIPLLKQSLKMRSISCISIS